MKTKTLTFTEEELEILYEGLATREMFIKREGAFAEYDRKTNKMVHPELSDDQIHLLSRSVTLRTKLLQ